MYVIADHQLDVTRMLIEGYRENASNLQLLLLDLVSLVIPVLARYLLSSELSSHLLYHNTSFSDLRGLWSDLVKGLFALLASI